MSISLVLIQFLFKRDLARNINIEITLVCDFCKIWRLWRVKDTKFSMNASNKKILNAAKPQAYRFYRFWAINRKPIGGKNSPNRTQIKFKELLHRYVLGTWWTCTWLVFGCELEWLYELLFHKTPSNAPLDFDNYCFPEYYSIVAISNDVNVWAAIQTFLKQKKQLV